MARALGPGLPSQQLCCGRWLPAAPCQLRSPGCRSPFLWLPGTSTVTAVPRALSGTPDQGQPEALWVALVSSANSTTWPNPVSLFSSANFRPLANGPEGSAPSSAARRARHTPRPAEPAFGAAGPGQRGRPRDAVTGAGLVPLHLSFTRRRLRSVTRRGPSGVASALSLVLGPEVRGTWLLGEERAAGSGAAR